MAFTLRIQYLSLNESTRSANILPALRGHLGVADLWDEFVCGSESQFIPQLSNAKTLYTSAGIPTLKCG
jgi:hypothetical protein